VLSLFPDLRGKLDQAAGELSGGQRQMVAMGRALMSEPKLLLLDEPTAGLSPAYLEIIFDLLLDIRKRGVTILMVEQNAKQALRIADHGHVLVSGRISFRNGGGRCSTTMRCGGPFSGVQRRDRFHQSLSVPGLTIGSVYALGAVGISMIFGILRFAHFAHGDLMTIGAYGVLTAVWFIPLHPLLLLPVRHGAGNRFGAGGRRVLLQAAEKVADHLHGDCLLRRGADLPLAGAAVLEFRQPGVHFRRSAATGAVRHVSDFGAASAGHHSDLIIAVALHFFLTRSKLGRSMRAVSDEPELASVAGLDTERVVRWTWVIGAALAATAGVFAGMDTSDASQSGLEPAAGDVCGSRSRRHRQADGRDRRRPDHRHCRGTATFTWFSDEP
jgi:branched-chain amino acid transport system permease protein